MLPRCRSETGRIPFISQSSRTATVYFIPCYPFASYATFYQCITPNMEFLLHADRLGHYFEWTSGCTYPHSRGFTMNPLGTSDERTPLPHSPFTMRRPETQALCQRTRTSRALIGRERSTVSGETRAGMCTCRGLVAGQTQGNQHNIKSTPCLH